jgi:predicted nuclease with TOPRIM domain
MITISIAALATLSVVTFNYLANKKKALDLLAKYNSIKEYADNAAKHILKLEEDNSNLSASVIKLKSLHQSVNDQLTAEKRKFADLATEIENMAAKAPKSPKVVKTQNSTNNSNNANGTRRGRPNKA